MRNYKKILLWAATALLTLSLGVWAYYVSINLKHVYTLLDCSKGQVALIPKHLCQTYLFNYGGTQDDVAQINYDGSLYAIVSTARKEDQSKLLEFLLKKGVDINGLDERAGISPLHAAVLDNALEITELFLHHGANPLIKDKKSSLTPLEFALQLKGKLGQPDRTAIIKLLEHATKS
jgi:ankyrin repeat protein